MRIRPDTALLGKQAPKGQSRLAVFAVERLYVIPPLPIILFKSFRSIRID